MINQYPLWKYLVVLTITVVGLLYALPNIYGKDPAVLVSPLRAMKMDSSVRKSAEQSLKKAGISYQQAAIEGD